MVFEICVIVLLGTMLVVVSALFARVRELCEYALRIAYGLTSLSGALDMISSSSNSSRCSLENIESKLDALSAEKPAEENPADPDEEAERSEAAKAAEKAFSEGVLNILNYSLGAEEAKH